MFTDYNETLEFLFSQLPMFQNVGKTAYTKDLKNTIQLLDFLGNPHHKTKTKWIHIGGTNGKGSTSSMLAAILTANGYKTGLYTSPHLIDFRERIRIDGEMISEKFIIDFTNKILPICEKIQPSFFEMTVGLAFDYFKTQAIDIGIIEVGLGGRLDSTNVINPILSAITSIGFDHMDILGNTIEAIASEKAGIIKPNTPYLIGNMPEEASETIHKVARANQGIFKSNIPTPANWSQSASLKGIYQVSNLNLVYNIYQTLLSLNIELNEHKSIDGISQVNRFTGLRGRWEIVNDHPLTICDTGHNKDGIEMIVAQLKSLQESGKQLRIVWGMVKDKDVTAILNILPNDAAYYLCKPNVVRGLESSVLKEKFDKLNLKSKDLGTVSCAFQTALEESSQNDIIFIGGSTFVVGNFLEYLAKSN